MKWTKRLGTNILFITGVGIVLMVTILLVVTLLTMRNYNDTIMLERAVDILSK